MRQDTLVSSRRINHAFARLAAGQGLQDVSYGCLVELWRHAESVGSLQLAEATKRELLERLHGFGCNPAPGAD